MTEKEKHPNDDSGEAEKDPITEAMGDFGPWQLIMVCVVGSFIIPCCYPVLNLSFMNASNDFWCAPPAGIANQTSVEQWREISGQSVHGACAIYDVDYEQGFSQHTALSSETPTRPCQKWDYDRVDFESTFTTEWDLVCENAYLKSIAQTVFFLGMLGGVSGAGLLCDWYGRKMVIVSLLISMSIVGIICAYMPTFILFTVGRFFHALIYIGVLECIFTWVLEIAGVRYKAQAGIGIDFFWVVGWMSLSLMAYLLNSWRHLLMATSLPGFASIILIWVMPESPRWLLSMGRVSEAEEIIKKVAKFNGRSLPEGWHLRDTQPKAGEVVEETAGFMDLFGTPEMRMKTTILYINWFTNSFCYYGLTLNSPSYGTSMLVSFTINGLLEIPAYASAIFLLSWKGRRIPYASSMILTGISLLSILFLPEQGPDASPGSFTSIMAMTIALFGKFWVTVSFASVFLYTAELYPTTVRTTALGTSSCMARFGGMACGWVALLKVYHAYLPLIVYGAFALFSGIIAIKLPETKGKKLPDTLAEGEALKTKNICC
eukprot:snap_masked-scaffold2424_size15851-processed-gene-0.2 protein:Tk01794 transcript:snap_masked-scaffold2424_size15851-processed-gene-0.2-mRNA-1 annotation:"organic cation transporter protein"